MSVWMNCYKCGNQNRLTDGNILDGRYLHEKKCNKCNAPIIERQGDTTKIRAPLCFAKVNVFENMINNLKDERFIKNVVESMQSVNKRRDEK